MRLIVGDKCSGMLETMPKVFSEAKYQRCTVHFYQNIFSVVPKKTDERSHPDAQSDLRSGM